MLAEEHAAWLRLALTPGVAPAAAYRLLREFGLPAALFAPLAAPAASAARRQRMARLCGPEAAQALTDAPGAELRAAQRNAEAWLEGDERRFLLTLADADYPRALLDLRDAPILLYGAGRRTLLGLPGVAIVGSRHGTRQGMQNAQAFAAQLGHAGLCIVSGMAGGIDSAAHRGALDAGCATIAWLGTGADVVYPAANRELAAAIARDGLLLTEYALGTPPLAPHFPRRNRLIAALVRGVLVVEAALHSGSLITARLAVELGREVCAIPGSIHAPLARGCHRLIRDGARPDARLAGLLELLGHDPVGIDTLTRRSGQEAGAVAARLLELELAGAVERLPGNRYQRVTGTSGTT